MTKPGLPIVFIHRSNPEYLKYSLAQATITNPESPIILIGDDSNNKYDFVDVHANIPDYMERANLFEKYYRHFSTNSFNFELVCFQRWFILEEFLLKNKIENCLYLDSDIMLFADVTQDKGKFMSYDFTLSHYVCGSIFFLNNINGLNKLCAFMFDIYAGKEKYYFDKLVSHYVVRKMHNLPGGACDMTVLEYYQLEHFGEVGEASLIIDDSVYEPNINLPAPGLEMKNKIKNVQFDSDGPYGIHEKNKNKVKLNCLHCQGNAKSLMSELYYNYLKYVTPAKKDLLAG
jgi:hypothetical protein